MKRLLILLLLISGLFANSFLVINGNSYHHNVTEYDYCNNECNSNNWGIGYETHGNKNGLIYSVGTFMDSWDKFSWYGGMGGEYYINRFTNFGFSLGIMNKNYSVTEEITTLYMFPYVALHITDYVIISTTIIPTSKLVEDWTMGNNWPTTLFFQYKVRVSK